MKLFPSLLPFLRRWSLAAAALATLVAAFYVIENWRGERAWAGAMERLRAAGEPVTLEEWLPKPPPDDQNFMLNPVFVRRHGFRQVTRAKLEGGLLLPTTIKVAEDTRPLRFPYEALGTCDGTRKVDMGAIAAFLPEPLRPPAEATQQQAAHAILQWIGQWEPDLAALMEAARTRPVSHLPWSGEADLMLRWQSVNGWYDLAKVLQLRSIAQVTAGDGAGALGSIGLMLRLGRAAAAEPAFLSNYVLSVATIALVGVPLNHCLATHLYTDAQLVEMEYLLRPIDFRADFRRALRGERFYLFRAVEEIIARDGKLFARVSPELPALALTFSPRGWWRQNQVRAVDWQLEQEQRLRTPASLRPKPKSGSVTSPYDPRTVLFSSFAAHLRGVETHTDTLEAQFTLARIAIALERYRLAHGFYPEALSDLDGLFPSGPPADPLSGKPPRYALAGGQPRIWSVGPNQRDDGGREDAKDADDILWAYPMD